MGVGGDPLDRGGPCPGARGVLLCQRGRPPGGPLSARLPGLRSRPGRRPRRGPGVHAARPARPPPVPEAHHEGLRLLQRGHRHHSRGGLGGGAHRAARGPRPERSRQRAPAPSRHPRLVRPRLALHPPRHLPRRGGRRAGRRPRRRRSRPARAAPEGGRPAAVEGGPAGAVDPAGVGDNPTGAR